MSICALLFWVAGSFCFVESTFCNWLWLWPPVKMCTLMNGSINPIKIKTIILRQKLKFWQWVIFRFLGCRLLGKWFLDQSALSSLRRLLSCLFWGGKSFHLSNILSNISSWKRFGSIFLDPLLWLLYSQPIFPSLEERHPSRQPNDLYARYPDSVKGRGNI